MTEQELKEIEFALNNSTSIQIIQKTCIPKLIAEIRSLQKEVCRLQKERADAPTVFAACDHGDNVCKDAGWFNLKHPTDATTHTARLVDIKKIGEAE